MRYNGLGVVLTLLLSVTRGGEGRVVEPQSPDRTGFQVLRLQASDSGLVDTALRLADEHEVGSQGSGLVGSLGSVYLAK